MFRIGHHSKQELSRIQEPSLADQDYALPGSEAIAAGLMYGPGAVVRVNDARQEQRVLGDVGITLARAALRKDSDTPSGPVVEVPSLLLAGKLSAKEISLLRQKHEVVQLAGKSAIVAVTGLNFARRYQADTDNEIIRDLLQAESGNGTKVGDTAPKRLIIGTGQVPDPDRLKWDTNSLVDRLLARFGQIIQLDELGNAEILDHNVSSHRSVGLNEMLKRADVGADLAVFSSHSNKASQDTPSAHIIPTPSVEERALQLGYSPRERALKTKAS